MDAMDGFDTTMSYLADPARLGFLPQSGYLQSASTGMDLHDQISNLDDQSFMSVDDFALPSSDGRGHPPLQRFASSYDDFFPDAKTSNFESTLPEQMMAEDTALDRENKLLGFPMPIYHFTLLDYSLRRTSLNMSAHLHGMFFLAESQWPADPEAPPPPPELTCYRRNLFQITGSITVPRTLRYIMTDQGDRIPILAQELTVSATESVENNVVKIISVPWKTPAGGGPAAPEDKAEKEPPPIPLDTMGGTDVGTDCAVFPIQWKRLQFRIATANNGRRKELQQHFSLSLKIMATLSTGAKVAIAEAKSGAIIVRGRSPRNFSARKDLPLSTSASISRKTMGAGVSRSSAGESIPQVSQATPANLADQGSQAVFQQCEQRDRPSETAESSHWNLMAQQDIHKQISIPEYNHPMMPPQMPPYSNLEPADVTQMMPLTNHNLSAFNDPTSLSFSSDEERGSPIPQRSRPSRPRPPTSNPSGYGQAIQDPPSRRPMPTPSSSSPTPDEAPQRQRPRLTSPQSYPSPSFSKANKSNLQHQRIPTKQATSLPFLHSSTTTAQQSNNPALNHSTRAAAAAAADDYIESSPSSPSSFRYEYFPLSLDDWLPPVDVIPYPPHHDHHRHRHLLHHDESHDHGHSQADPRIRKDYMGPASGPGRTEPGFGLGMSNEDFRVNTTTATTTTTTSSKASRGGADVDSGKSRKRGTMCY